MHYFGLQATRIEQSGATWTTKEINQQPAVWKKVAAQALRYSVEIDQFIAALLDNHRLRIVLTGAGTSAFIGDCLAPAMSHTLGRWVDAVSTTDLVARPDGYLYRDVPTLLVSFARSGNSPESVAAIDLCEQFVSNCQHLIITCNREGKLSERGNAMRNAKVIVLPDETNDRSFAMTSSFSSMLLAAGMIFRVLPREAAQVNHISAAAEKVMADIGSMLPALVENRFERVIYLGSGALKGLAREAALKMLELSDGQVIATSDTSLGFRHGPKTIVNHQTLIVVMLSNDPTTRRYDLDILRELRGDAVAGRIVAVSAIADAATAHPDHILVDFMARESDIATCLPFVVFAQALALVQSIALGLKPDSPNASGTVNRVVQGVTIYPALDD